MKKLSERSWFRVDNAGKLFPAIVSYRRSGVFRIWLNLTDTVDPGTLEEAANKILPRFPSFNIQLKKGFFWRYFQENPHRFIVKRDVKNPSQRIHLRTNNYYLFRIRYYQKRIAVEFFHALTDGTGAMIFLKTLVAEYLKIKGSDIPAKEGVLDISINAPKDELEDSYSKYYRKESSRAVKEKPAYHVSGRNMPRSNFRITTGKLSTKAVIKKAKEHGVSITEYLVSIYLYSLYNIQKRKQYKKPRAIRIAVPVNLRMRFPSKTVRNFAGYVKAGIEPRLGEFSFEEILESVHHQIRYENNRKFLLANFSSNVRSEKNRLLKIMPLFIKEIAIWIVFHLTAEYLYSGSLSNLGRVVVPEEMQPFIEDFGFALGPGSSTGANMAVISYNDTLAINIGSTLFEKEIEQEVFSQLVKEGLNVKIHSNYI